MTKKERLEMNTLSKQVLGATSCWYDIVTKGKTLPKLDAEGKAIEGHYIVERLSVTDLHALLLTTKQKMLELENANEEALEAYIKRQSKEAKEAEEKEDAIDQRFIDAIPSIIEEAKKGSGLG